MKAMASDDDVQKATAVQEILVGLHQAKETKPVDIKAEQNQSTSDSSPEPNTARSVSEPLDISSSSSSADVSASRPYHCTFCIKTFARRDTLKEHLRTHTKEKPFACAFCTAKFPTQSTRKKHERTHVGDKRYECSHCGLRFSGKPSLNYHLMVHSGVRPFKCHFCSKGFFQNSHLSRHIRVHTGEKPFVCGICGMKFVRNSSLQNHERKHTGEVLFSCQHCDKTFSTKESFDYHLKAHAGVKPFHCSFCGWAFIKASHLKRHLRIHKLHGAENSNYEADVKQKCVGETSQSSLEGESPPNQVRTLRRWSYSCTFCIETFAHKRSLESHLKFHAAKGVQSHDVQSRAEFPVNGDQCATNDSDGDYRLPAELLCDVKLEIEGNEDEDGQT